VAIPKSHGSALDQAGFTLPAGECDLERLGSQLLADLETRPLLQVGTEPVVLPLEDKTYRNRLPSSRDDASSSASLGSLCMGSARMKPERKPIQTQGPGSTVPRSSSGAMRPSSQRRRMLSSPECG
jgi:hypothetical protein